MTDVVERRTLRDFVEDMVTDLRPLWHILAVAQSTRWKNDKKEIEEKVIKLRRWLGTKSNRV